MKKFVLLFVCASFVLSGYSQEKNKSFMKDLGLFAAPGFSSVLGGDSWKGNFGFIAGVDSKLIPLCETSYIVAGLGLAFQGAAWEDSWSDGYGSNTYSGNTALTYLIIPILYNHLLNNNIYVEFGIQPGILLAAKDNYDGESMDYKDALKTVDLGIVGGGGYHVNDKLDVGARLVFGLPNIYDTSGSDWTDGDTKDHNFMVLVVARFSIWNSEN